MYLRSLIALVVLSAALCPATAESDDPKDHWAFTAPQRPDLPEVRNEAWVRNPIDRFVVQRLEQEGLSPSPEADRLTLMRRLSLDLTGLPPSLELLRQPHSANKDDDYVSIVDRMLHSPHHGERWARHWLDAAQYADSDGFEKDKPRQVAAWRDWVINALNENMPYDQFVVHQVAGDLLEDATQKEHVATGFLRNSMINEEGGIQPEQFRMEALFNRMDVIGRSVLGLTVGCAQCHTHKYDPISHTDYYRMLAFLNNTHEANMSVYTENEQQQRDEIVAVINDIEDQLKQRHPDWQLRMAAWQKEARLSPNPDWHAVSLLFDDTTAGGQKFTPQEDGSYLSQGYAPTRFGPKMYGDAPINRVTAVRLELLPDPNLPRGGPGRSIYGTGALSEFVFRYAPANTPIEDNDKWTRVEIASAIADVNPSVQTLGPEYPDRGDKVRQTGPIAMAIDGNKDTAWTTDIDPGRRNQARYAIFILKEPLELPADTLIAFTLEQHHGGWNSDDNQTNNLGRFRLSLTDADALPTTAIPLNVKKLIDEDRPLTKLQKQTVFDYWRTTDSQFREANLRTDALWQAFPSGTTQLVLEERDALRTTHRLNRGDFLQPEETVERGVPKFLHPLQSDGTPDRLDFARWLTARDSPTTARTFVNRVWQHYFGQGITPTSSDLGLQGAPPTHPELLDWLAVEFMDSGWDIKHLHRLIVESATYRQSSRVTPDLLERDPDNILFARGARFRVEGEIVRDIALAASGLLNPTVGGASVYPPAPAHLFLPPASYGPKPWNSSQGPDRYRRALYTFRFRSVPYPVLQAFDTPPGNAPCTLRDRSNSPLQALVALNEPLFFECARALASMTLDKGGETDRMRLEFAFQRCLTRKPDRDELDTLQAFLDKQRDRIRSGSLDATSILGESAPDAISPQRDLSTDLAAWTLTARVLLNLDETIVRQ